MEQEYEVVIKGELDEATAKAHADFVEYALAHYNNNLRVEVRPVAKP